MSPSNTHVYVRVRVNFIRVIYIYKRCIAKPRESYKKLLYTEKGKARRRERERENELDDESVTEAERDRGRDKRERDHVNSSSRKEAGYNRIEVQEQ